MSRVELYCIVFSDRQADLNYCIIVLYACTCIFVVLYFLIFVCVLFMYDFILNKLINK